MKVVFLLSQGNINRIEPLIGLELTLMTDYKSGTLPSAPNSLMKSKEMIMVANATNRHFNNK